MSTTKRHPSRLRARIGATRDGRLTAMDFAGEFNTGAYASWGSTVANRVPVHAGGPVRLRRVSRAHRRRPHERPAVGRVPRVRRAAIDDRAGVPVRRARGRGRDGPARVPVPQRAHGGGADGHRAGVRRRASGIATAWRPCVRTGSARRGGVGRGERRRRLDRAAASASPACGTAAATRRCRTRRRSRWGSSATGASRSIQGAVDMGQGANTVMTQICADAIGVDDGVHRDARRGHGHHAGRGQELRVEADVRLRQRDLPGGHGAPRPAAGARRRVGRGAHRVRRHAPGRARP